jgi:hypothetical protein
MKPLAYNGSISIWHNIMLFPKSFYGVLSFLSLNSDFNFNTDDNNDDVDDDDDVVVWHIVVTLLSGIIIGILFSYIVSYSRRRWSRNRKPGRNSEPQTAGVDTTYQELDLTKMNTHAEDNYQSLNVNAAAASASNDVANDDDSTYTQLSKTRDVEDNYQSLT